MARRSERKLPTVLAWLFVASTAAVLMASGVQAQTPDIRLRFEGKDSGCTGGKTMCFVETTGNLSRMMPGQHVDVEFNNVGTTRHMWMVTDGKNMDSMHRNTEHHMAMAQMEDVEPGQMMNTSFTVPSGAPSLYFWCGEAGHEQLGMWLEQSIQSSDVDSTPLPGWIAVLGLLGALFALRRGR